MIFLSSSKNFEYLIFLLNCDCFFMVGLPDTWGDEFEKLYVKYENTPGLARKTIKAQDLWFAILESQIETGTPYMLYKDACNRKSNHQNLGTIRCSNLCTEIVEYTAPDEVAVCNLASIALPKFVVNGKFDYQKLFDITSMRKTKRLEEKAIQKRVSDSSDISFWLLLQELSLVIWTASSMAISIQYQKPNTAIAVTVQLELESKV